MNVKAFFVDALGAALDLELGTPDDVLRHVTTDVLAQHLPRPLWARLLTACLGAPRVDARLVIETIGIPNLCEHVPAPIMWAVIADIGERALGVVALSKPASAARPLVSPPPEVVTPVAAAAPALTTPASGVAVRPIPQPNSAPLADLLDELEADDRPGAPARASGPAGATPARAPTQPRFRQAQTGIGRGATGGRRPQAPAPAPATTAPVRPLPRRGSTEVSEIENDTEIGKDGWSKDTAIAVDDSQLVDWSSSEETQAGDERKR